MVLEAWFEDVMIEPAGATFYRANGIDIYDRDLLLLL